ncbi:hypothetical protein C5167_031143 [Papaver somniferum]|nr:hypothetical protein C5167_031143 [Papaver somniferum]
MDFWFCMDFPTLEVPNFLPHCTNNGGNVIVTQGFLSIASIGLTDKEEGDLGPIYGFQWRYFGARYTNMLADYSGQGFDQLLGVIEKIKNKPDDRRIIPSAWNPLDLGLVALPPCHMFSQISFLVILSMLFGDAHHVYKTHGRPLQKQLQKLPRPFPTLKISSEKKDIDSFVATNFKLMDYDPRRKIEMKMAVFPEH